MDPNENPEELVLGCIRKDRKSWDAFVERYSKVVYWAIRDRLRRYGYDHSEEDINDIHQDVFVALWAGGKLSQLKERGKVAGWLAMVAGNAAIEHFRRARRQSPPSCVSLYEQVYRDDDGKTIEEVLPSGAAGPDRQAQLNEARAELVSAIERLSPKERMAARMSLLHGMKHAQIAAALELPVNTVSTTVARAKKNLKEKLEKRRLL